MLDSKKTNQIAAEIQAALNEIAQRHGLTAPVIDLRRDRAGTFCRLMKTDMNVVTAGTSAPTIQVSSVGGISASLQRGMDYYGIKNAINAKGERLVEYKPNRPKYPFVMEGPRGGRWKLEPTMALAKFGTVN